MNPVEKLMTELNKVSIIKEGEIYTNKDGIRYQYVDVQLKYKTTAYYLELLFISAVTYVTGKSHLNRFKYDGYSFYYQTTPLKNEPNGKIEYRYLKIYDNENNFTIYKENS